MCSQPDSPNQPSVRPIARCGSGDRSDERQYRRQRHRAKARQLPSSIRKQRSNSYSQRQLKMPSAHSRERRQQRNQASAASVDTSNQTGGAFSTTRATRQEGLSHKRLYFTIQLVVALRPVIGRAGSSADSLVWVAPPRCVPQHSEHPSHPLRTADDAERASFSAQ